MSRPPGSKSRKYSDREKAEALAIYDACGTLAGTARATGISDATISAWIVHNRGINSDVQAMRVQGHAALLNKFDKIAELSTDHVIARLSNSTAVADTPLPHLMNAAGIAVDKAQLLRGLPTSITENTDRQELVVILTDALAGAIDVTPQ